MDSKLIVQSWMAEPSRDLVGKQIPIEVLDVVWVASRSSQLYRSLARQIEEVTDLNYKQRELIGKGGYGSVFAAYRNRLGLPPLDDVVLKIQDYIHMPLDTHSGEPNEIYFMRLLEERVSFTPKLIDAYPRGDKVVIVMERVQGLDLANFVSKTKNKESVILIILRQLYEMLVHLNDLGLHHGDLKGENLVWDGTQLFMIDFGAMYLGPKAKKHASPVFVTPEMKAGACLCSAEGQDIWCFGNIVYLLCTGQYLYFDKRGINDLSSSLSMYKMLIQGTMTRNTSLRFSLNDVRTWLERAERVIPETSRSPSSPFPVDISAAAIRAPVTKNLIPQPYGRKKTPLVSFSSDDRDLSKTGYSNVIESHKVYPRKKDVSFAPMIGLGHMALDEPLHGMNRGPPFLPARQLVDPGKKINPILDPVAHAKDAARKVRLQNPHTVYNEYRLPRMMNYTMGNQFKGTSSDEEDDDDKENKEEDTVLWGDNDKVVAENERCSRDKPRSDHPFPFYRPSTEPVRVDAEKVLPPNYQGPRKGSDDHEKKKQSNVGTCVCK